MTYTEAKRTIRHYRNMLAMGGDNDRQLIHTILLQADELKQLRTELAEQRQLLAVYRDQAEAATGALNAEKQRADVAEQERDQARAARAAVPRIQIALCADAALTTSYAEDAQLYAGKIVAGWLLDTREVQP